MAAAAAGGFEALKAIDEVCAVERIAADPHNRRLAKTCSVGPKTAAWLAKSRMQSESPCATERERGGAGWREDAGGGDAGVTSRCGLVHGLVGERARAGNDCDPAFLVDVAGHDPDLALARLDDARAVRLSCPQVLSLVWKGP